MKQLNAKNRNVLTERQVSQFIGLSIQKLRNDRHLRRGLPYFKIGRSVRYLMDDIETFIDQHRIDPGL